MRGALMVMVSFAAAIAAADTFTNTKTGERLEGKLLGTMTKDGEQFLVVKTESGVKQVRMAIWRSEAPTKPATATKPGTARAPRKTFRWPEIQYGGKLRDSAWLERAYKKAAEQIIVCEGAAVNKDDIVWVGLRSTHRSVGQIFKATGRVTQILPGGRILGSLENLQSVLIEGAATAGWTDGKEWTATLVGVGTWQYTTVMGARRTILRCHLVPSIPKLLTREEFAKALQDGVSLYTWRNCPKCSGYGYIYVQKWRKSGMNKVGYRAKKRCPACGGKKRYRVNLAKGGR